MSRVIGLLVCASVMATAMPVYAQGQPDIVVRQGDTIEWIGAAGGPQHKLNFGAAGTTPVAEITTILDFKPPLAGGESKQGSGLLVSATVKEDKATIGKKFVFTCGVHPVPMLSVSFVVAPRVPGEAPRTFTVMGESGLHWHVHADTTK